MSYLRALHCRPRTLSLGLWEKCTFFCFCGHIRTPCALSVGQLMSQQVAISWKGSSLVISITDHLSLSGPQHGNTRHRPTLDPAGLHHWYLWDLAWPFCMWSKILRGFLRLRTRDQLYWGWGGNEWLLWLTRCGRWNSEHLKHFVSSHEAFLAIVPKGTVEISQDTISFSLFRDWREWGGGRRGMFLVHEPEALFLYHCS